jgi:hypothetical protein
VRVRCSEAHERLRPIFWRTFWRTRRASTRSDDDESRPACWQRGVAWDDPRTQQVESERIAVVEEARDAWGRTMIRCASGSDVRQRFEEWRAASAEDGTPILRDFSFSSLLVRLH